MGNSWRRLGLSVLLAAGLPSIGRATSGFCSITAMVQPTLNIKLSPRVGPAIDMAIKFPVEFDESSGAFSIVRDPWYAAFGELGAKFAIAGPTIHAYLRMYNGTSLGTLDRNGQLVMPAFPVTSSTDYSCTTCNESDPRTFPSYPIATLDALTGLQVRRLAEKPYVVEGTPLDFATGSVRLYGMGFLSGAVGSGGTNLSGIDLTCTVNPIPTQASLPAGATIAKVAGKAKVDATPQDGDKGDQLTLKATLVPGASPLDLTGGSPFILRVGGLTLLVQDKNFQVKGHKLIVKRDDTCKVKKGEATGVCKADPTASCTSFADCAAKAKLEVVEGQKATSTVRSQVGGQLVIVQGRKGAIVALKLQGLDLRELTGAQTVRMAVGLVNARKDVVVTGASLK